MQEHSPTTTDLGAGHSGEGHTHYTDLQVRSLLRQEPDATGTWRWAIDPYQGCELDCPFCASRQPHHGPGAVRPSERVVGVRTNAVGALLRDLREQEGRRAKLVLGSSCDPWQPAEERFHLTRAILTALCDVDGLGPLEANTRCSLVARDTDLLLKLSAKVPVRVVLSIATLDDGLSQTIEPRAPAPLRRLAALEAMARAGLDVELSVSPVLPGFPEQERGLEALLTRAAHAGARCATLSFADFRSGRAHSLKSHLAVAYPQLAGKLRALAASRARREQAKSDLVSSFEDCCKRLGLAFLHGPWSPSPPRREPPAQLALFELVTSH